MKDFNGRSVNVFDGNIEKAIRTFKKKVQATGVLMDVKDRETFTKPSVQRKLAKSIAKKRWQKKVQQSLPRKN